MIIRAFKYVFGKRNLAYSPTVNISNEEINQSEFEERLKDGRFSVPLQMAIVHHDNTMPRLAMSSVGTTSSAVLDMLANDDCPYVRSNVAAHPRTAVQTLRKLVTDKDEFVQGVAKSVLEVEKKDLA